MGLGIVLIFWAVAGVILASFGAALLALATTSLTRRFPNGRRKAIMVASLLPFCCLAWGGVVFVFQATINEGLLHRDLGLGDGRRTPLPDGYMVSFIDVTDQGSLCSASGGEDGCTNSPSVAGVRLLQVSGSYLLGAADSRWFQELGQPTSAVDQFFLLDTRDGKKTMFTNVGELSVAASKLGIALHLEPIYSVYSRYRFTWFDILAGCLLVLPPLGALVLFACWIVRLRRIRTTVASD